MNKIILILVLLFNSGCALIVAKETVKAVDIILDEGPNPEKQKKIIKTLIQVSKLIKA